MPKAQGKTQRQKFSYNVNRKRLNRNARRKAAPQIECSHIRHAWDHTKSVRQNLAEMWLAMDPNEAVPLRKRKVKAMEVDTEERPKDLVRKPYVVNDLEAEASLPEKKGNTLSLDLSIMFITWWRITGRTIRPWPGMRRITIKTPQNRFRIRSMSISTFTQRNGKSSWILCRIRRWRKTEWCTPPVLGLLNQRNQTQAVKQGMCSFR